MYGAGYKIEEIKTTATVQNATLVTNSHSRRFDKMITDLKMSLDELLNTDFETLVLNSFLYKKLSLENMSNRVGVLLYS